MGCVFRLNRDGVSPVGRVLRAADVAVLLEANAVLDAAAPAPRR